MIFRFVLGAVGLALLGNGAYGLLTSPQTSPPEAVGQWLVGGLILHDALLAPAVYVLGAIACRFTSARWRGRLAALLLIGGSLTLISLPEVLRQGRNANPTVLPLDYARNIGLLLGALVTAMALYSAVDAARRRRTIVRRAVAVAAAAACVAELDGPRTSAPDDGEPFERDERVELGELRGEPADDEAGAPTVPPEETGAVETDAGTDAVETDAGTEDDEADGGKVHDA
jgi:hypothetical protein